MVVEQRRGETAPVLSDLLESFFPREGQMFSRTQVLHQPAAISTLFFSLSSSKSLLYGFSSNIRKRCKIWKEMTVKPFVTNLTHKKGEFQCI